MLRRLLLDKSAKFLDFSNFHHDENDVERVDWVDLSCLLLSLFFVSFLFVFVQKLSTIEIGLYEIFMT